MNCEVIFQQCTYDPEISEGFNLNFYTYSKLRAIFQMAPELSTHICHAVADALNFGNIPLHFSPAKCSI